MTDTDKLAREYDLLLMRMFAGNITASETRRMMDIEIQLREEFFPVPPPDTLPRATP